MRLIGLNGFKGSGKDTAYGFIKAAIAPSDSVAYRVAFADKLKYAALLALKVGPDDALEFADDLKADGDIAVGIGGNFAFGITGREYLQGFGVAGRAIFGVDFWVDQVLPRTRAGLEAEYLWVDVLVVTDVRFPNEAERVTELGGEVWQIRRPGEESDGHESEQRLPDDLVDRVIHNDGTLDEFEVAVLSALKEALA